MSQLLNLTYTRVPRHGSLRLLSVSTSDEDAELESFALRAQEALNELDPPPPDVSVIAALAYELRDIQTVDLEQDRDPALAGVRSGAATADRVEHQGTSLTWERQDGHLVGVVTPVEASVELQVVEGASSPVTIDTADGSFRVAMPASPCRFVIAGADGSWATSWLA